MWKISGHHLLQKYMYIAKVMAHPGSTAQGLYRLTAAPKNRAFSRKRTNRLRLELFSIPNTYEIEQAFS